MSIKITTALNRRAQTLDTSQFGRPVVLLEKNDKLGPAGTVVIPLDLPDFNSGLLALRYDNIDGFQGIYFDDTVRKVSCRPMEPGESVTFTQE